MPKRVYRGKSGYEFRPPEGGAIKLCGLDASKDTVKEAYNKVLQDLNPENNLASLIDEYFKSEKFTKLAEETKEDYRRCSNNILLVFGQLKPHHITDDYVAEYLHKRGISSHTRANREKAFLSSAFSWGIDHKFIPTRVNPCKLVPNLKEKPRDRYIYDHEYYAVYNEACPAVKAAMEIAYRCAARVSDIISLTNAQLTPKGIFIQQGKTGIKQIKLWTVELREAVDECRNAFDVESKYVIHRPDGRPHTRDSLYRRWRRALSRASKRKGIPLDFTFHDLKAKGISDFVGTLYDKQSFSGHKTPRQTAAYIRNAQPTKTIGKSEDK
ncbi:tyrosine-type recombinase/integrase [Photobacterium sp. BZF1]|nr:tyrosine-type recombinase/integrase [Photobacterium sp. BZF1]